MDRKDLCSCYETKLEMAIAGVHTVTTLESTFLRESLSRSSGREGDGGRGGTRSSSVLQMWREIEDEQVVRPVQGRRMSSRFWFVCSLRHLHK